MSELPCRLILLLLLALPFISSHVCLTDELPESYCMESTIASKIPFKDLCSLCEKISNSPRQKKGEYLKKFVSYFRDNAKKMKQQSPFIVSTICTECFIFNVLCLIYYRLQYVSYVIGLWIHLELLLYLYMTDNCHITNFICELDIH